MAEAPTIDDIKALRRTLGDAVHRTPVLQCAALEAELSHQGSIYAKLEILQQTGTFKARGALGVVSGLSTAQKQRGITAVSAGNHAIAAAYAARAAGTSAKIVMIGSANPYRVAACRDLGAEIVMVDDVHAAFAKAEAIQAEEGRFLVHPFEGPGVATGTGMVGLEISEQVAQFDAVVVTVGGGGLIGGTANALKQLHPGCQVIGVEPEGADSMRRSLAAGEPVSLERVDTIADSLGAPFALPYSFALCQQSVDDIALVSDLQIREAMGWIFTHMKMAVEPACAAAVAAVFGPLRQILRGKNVVLVFCGSNIDWQSFSALAVMPDSMTDRNAAG